MFKYNDGGREYAGYKGGTGDCVCRAISIATEQTYQTVYDDLNNLIKSKRKTKKAKRSDSRTGVHRKFYEEYLKNLGWKWKATMEIGSGCKVHLKADELPQGRIIVRVTKHLTTMINGVIQDTYNPSRDGERCVYGYYYK